MNLRFLGGCREVGKSAVLVKHSGGGTLLDCGIKLGAKDDQDRFPYIPKEMMDEIDSIVISHAHLDHSGYLPHLYSRGWRGTIYATKPTRDLMQLLLSDYLKIAKEERDPDFSQQDINNIMKDVEYVEFDKKLKIAKGTHLTLYKAGHIIGASLTRIEDRDSSVLYTGDFSYKETNILDEATAEIEETDALIMESTYGDKGKIPGLKTNSKKLAKEVRKTLKRGGKVIIPVFGVGRSQEIMITLDNYIKSGYIPKIDGFVDGMIKKSNSIHRQNAIYAKEEIPKRILMAQEDPFDSEYFNPPKTKNRSDVTKTDKGTIILTTSGMITGGPVIKYMEELADDPENKIILVGYQVEGTPGRDLMDGKKKVTLPNGKEVKVNAKVKSLHFSAHSDKKQLLDFVSDIPKPKKIFLMHGEISNINALNKELEKKGHETYIPRWKEEFRV